MPWSFVSLTFVSGTSDVPEKVSARIRQQTEPLNLESTLCACECKQNRIGEPCKIPLDAGISLYRNSTQGGRARRYGDAAAAARRIGKTGGIAFSHTSSRPKRFHR